MTNRYDRATVDLVMAVVAFILMVVIVGWLLVTT